MKNYYKILKLFLIVADIFFFLVFVILIISTLLSNKYDELIIIIPLFLFSVALISFIEIFLIKYYGSIVTSVEFNGNNVILITNTKKHILPAKYFSEVKEVNSFARTYIIYDDTKIKKKFIFQMKYSPFKTYHLNFQEMKEHMPYTKFSKL